jgi:hypothetical protein
MVALDELAHACKDRSRSIARLKCVLHPAPYGSYSDVRSQPERKPTHTERSTSSGMQQLSNIPDREPPHNQRIPCCTSCDILSSQSGWYPMPGTREGNEETVHSQR